MKSLLKMPLLYTLMLLAALVLHCKPKPEPVSPVVKPTPPVSTTTPASSTMVSSATTIITDVPISTTAPLPPEGCLVTRIIYKAVVRVNPTEEENVAVEGATYRVALKTDTRYFYDGQKRLVRAVVRYPSDGVDSLSYEYTPTRIYVRTKNVGPNSPASGSIRLDTIHLNAQGLAEGKDSYYKRAEYDAQGYLFRYYDRTQRVALENKVINGNIRVRYNYYGGEIGNIFDYMAYDTIRPAIPTPFPIYGKPDRNLLVVSRLQGNKSLIYPNDRDIYRVDHSYLFDSRGLVQRLIRRATSTGFDLDRDSGGIGVFNYEYSCP